MRSGRVRCRRMKGATTSLMRTMKNESYAEEDDDDGDDGGDGTDGGDDDADDKDDDGHDDDGDDGDEAVRCEVVGSEE